MAATRTDRDYRTLLVPHDFSPHAAEALEVAVDLARRLGSSLHLLHVVHPPAYAYAPFEGAVTAPIDVQAMEEAAEKSLRELAEGLDVPGGPVAVHVVEGAVIAHHIVKVAEALGADMIVMGTHGRTGLAHVFLGSVAERTMRRAPCPVLTVRVAEDGSREEG